MLIMLFSLLNSVSFSLLSSCSCSVLTSSMFARASDTTDSAPALPMTDAGGGSGGGNDGDGASPHRSVHFGLELDVVVVYSLVLLWCIVLW